MKPYDVLGDYFTALLKDHNLESEQIVITAKPLTPDEAIGNPEDRDYPLIEGRERMMQAAFRGNFGQAYTDRYGAYSGSLSDVAGMELTNNYRRAVFVSSLNAVMRYLGLCEHTVHCKDEEPKECSAGLADYIGARYGSPKIAMAGLQPRMVESLSPHFEMRVTDLDGGNIGSEKSGVAVRGPGSTREHLDWCDIALVTGSTLVNGTITDFIIEKPVVFFGVTIAGAAKVLGLETFCVCGK